MNSRVSIIVVSWNAREYLERCLRSIREANAACVCEVIVVDNESSDDSAEMVRQRFAEVKLMRPGCNLGFAGGNNLAMREATGDMLALVNSDSLVHRGCLETLVAYLESHTDAGLVGPRVVGADGRLQLTCRHLPSLWNTLCRALALDRLLKGFGPFAGYEIPEHGHDRLREADVLSGCFCMARRAAVEQVGGFDEQFFFYAEDIDWCKRLRDAGWKLVFVPQASATHFGGGSSSKAPLRYSVEILRATLKYWRKHHGRGGLWVCRALLVTHHAVRLVCRFALRGLGQARTPEARYKLEEDVACLRWLFFGTEVSPR